MIITRTPFRITLGGGGTDLPAYYSQYGGFVFSASINKYMFISINRPIVDTLVRVKYTRSETVSHREDLQHEIAKEAMRIMGIEDSLEIVSMADIPAGTGLGSSSCYAVGLLNALHAMKKDYIPLQDLAEEACNLEIDRLRKPIGKQDQYMAVFGGLRIMEIQKDGRVDIKSARVENSVLDELNKNLLMFFTSTSRGADKILSEQSRRVREQTGNVADNMHLIKEIGRQILEAVESGNLARLGLLFDEHWRHKKKISSEISNPSFDEIYRVAKQKGALGGKIVGAGGGGFFLFYVEDNHRLFREAMAGLDLREMRYRFDGEGTKILANFMNGIS